MILHGARNFTPVFFYCFQPRNALIINYKKCKDEKNIQNLTSLTRSKQATLFVMLPRSEIARLAADDKIK